MKFSIFLILAMFSAVLLLSSCIVNSHDYNVELSCDEFTENHHGRNEFEAEVGDKIRVALCSNPTTGFQWDYKTTIENVVKEEDHDFEEPGGDVTGAAGKELWTFEAIEIGATEVRMEYSQPWEGGLKSEWTYILYITVE